MIENVGELELNNAIWGLGTPICDILETLKEDQEAIENTPNRVCNAFCEVLNGYTDSPGRFLEKDFSVTPSDDLVVVKDIPFYSMCKHHMLPFFGVVNVGYLPHEKVIGLSKIPRLVKCLSQRLQIQEDLGRQICDTMMGSKLAPRGVIAVIKARHLCMEMRGIQATGAVTTTASISGVFVDNHDLKTEAYSIIGG